MGCSRWLSLRGEHLDTITLSAYEGVGLIKSEALALATGLYVNCPQRLAAIRDYVDNVCIAFAGRPVWYRLSCHSSRTANSLAGSHRRIDEHTPFLGCIGVRRLVAYPDEYMAEIQMVAELRGVYPDLGVILPYVYDPEEACAAIGIMKTYGYDGACGMMVEIPSAALLVSEFMDAGVKYCLIGLNDLASLTLGVARYQDTVASLYSRTHPSVIQLVEGVIAAGRKLGATVGIGGYSRHETGPCDREVAGHVRRRRYGPGGGLLHQADTGPVGEPEIRRDGVRCRLL